MTSHGMDSLIDDSLRSHHAAVASSKSVNCVRYLIINIYPAIHGCDDPHTLISPTLLSGGHTANSQEPCLTAVSHHSRPLLALGLSRPSVEAPVSHQ